MISDSTVQLGHGSGGQMMKRLIDEVFLNAFEAPELHAGNDAAYSAEKERRREQYIKPLKETN